jgi:hypothetical protein
VQFERETREPRQLAGSGTPGLETRPGLHRLETVQRQCRPGLASRPGVLDSWRWSRHQRCEFTPSRVVSQTSREPFVCWQGRVFPDILRPGSTSRVQTRSRGDHAHLLVRGLAATSDLRRFVKSAKERSGRAYRIRADARRYAAYIVNNPVRAGGRRRSAAASMSGRSGCWLSRWR